MKWYKNKLLGDCCDGSRIGSCSGLSIGAGLKGDCWGLEVGLSDGLGRLDAIRNNLE